MVAAVESTPELDKYELLEEIGHGGMATVYRARDRRLAREVAIKIIHRHLRENQEVARRFVSEALAVAKLRHPNIVEVYDVSDPDDDERYLVVELVRGTTLRKLLAKHGHLPAEIAAAIGIEIATALDHAHGLGVIHRDVKPENVLVATPSGGGERASDPDTSLIKITDFGIAKLLDAQGVTSTGQVLGSPAHMAPEQIEGGDVSARSDVFGLGVLLYEAMVGKLPFDGKNPAQVLRRVLDGSFTPADKALPVVGSSFSAIVGTALAHEQSARFASAAELCSALRRELDALGLSEPRKELRAFLLDPEGYRGAHEARMVERLIARAGEARKVRDVPLSAACLNRALAFRPDDASLLSEVATLGRRERLRRNVKSGATAAAASIVVAALGFAAVRSFAEGEVPETVSSSKAPPRAAARPSASARVAVRPVSSEAVVNESRPPKPRAPTGVVRERPLAPPPRPPAEELVEVRIVVRGPQGATVRIDGQERPWFGQSHQLTSGLHRFEFFPPANNPCCDPKPVVLEKEIRPPAEPGDAVTVHGVIPFRPATLQYRGPDGGYVECLGREIRSKAEVAMNRAQLSARCSFFPPAGSSQSPESFDVLLQPGVTLSVPPLQ